MYIYIFIHNIPFVLVGKGPSEELTNLADRCKGESGTRFSTSGFFLNKFPLGLLVSRFEVSLGAVSKFYENSERHSQICVIGSDTGDKEYTGVNDTDDKLSPVSLLLAIN